MNRVTNRRLLAAGVGAVLLAAIAGPALLVPGPAQAGQSPGERVFTPGAFRTLVVEIPAEVRVRRAGAARVVVHAEREVLDRIVVAVDPQGELRVTAPRGFQSNSGVRIDIDSGELISIRSDGAGSIDAAGVFASRFELRLEGVGDARISGFEGEHFTLRSHGSGSVSAQGHCTEQEVEMEGAASYDGRALRTRKTRVRISGTGDAQVAASDLLDVEITGVGSVKYLGSPQIRRNITGLGSVEAAGD
jgi:hypothetical protein